MDHISFSVKDLIPVDIQVFRQATRDIGFDVYLKLSDDNVAHVFSRTTGLDYKRLAHYIQKGVTHLYISSKDEAVFNSLKEHPAHEVFNNPETTQEKKIATLLNMTEQNMAELFVQVNVQEDTAVATQRIVKNYVDLMVQSPQTLATILKLVSHGEYLYYHSIAVSIFSMFIARATGQFNQKSLELVGLGGFLHDIGCTQLPKEIVSSSELTKEQWQMMRTHPKLGLKMLENSPVISDEVRYIVYQHHEEPGGHGYPNRLESSAIYYPAKIVAIADGFSALISRRPFRAAYPVEKAIEILQDGRAKYDQDLVKVVASIFIRGALRKAA